MPFAVFSVGLGIAVPAPASTQSSTTAIGQSTASCVLDVESAGGADGYGPVGTDRCEGLYVQPVSASARPVLQGFHLGPPRYDLSRDDSITVEVVGLDTPLEGGALIARSLRQRHHYQMDTRALSVSGRFVWETDGLRDEEIDLAPPELGVFFRRPADPGGTPPTVWPVRVLGDGSSSAGGTNVPYLVFESEIRLRELVVRVHDVASGELLGMHQIERSLSADWPVRVPFPVEEAGRYRVEVSTRAASGARGHFSFVAVVPGTDDRS